MVTYGAPFLVQGHYDRIDGIILTLLYVFRVSNPGISGLENLKSQESRESRDCRGLMSHIYDEYILMMTIIICLILMNTKGLKKKIDF